MPRALQHLLVFVPCNMFSRLPLAQRYKMQLLGVALLCGQCQQVPQTAWLCFPCNVACRDNWKARSVGSAPADSTKMRGIVATESLDHNVTHSGRGRRMTRTKTRTPCGEKEHKRTETHLLLGSSEFDVLRMLLSQWKHSFVVSRMESILRCQPSLHSL